VKKIAIIGAGGHGKIAAVIAYELGWDVFFFDDAYPENIKCGQWDVVGTLSCLMGVQGEFEAVFVAIGDNTIREQKQLTLENLGFNIVSLISPHATVSQSVSIGKGAIIVANACLNIGSVISDGAIINTGTNVDHDCFVGRFSHLSPGVNLAGGVIIGERTWIGIGSTVIQNKTINKDVIVGAGSVVINDIAQGETVFGCPARIKSTS